MSGLKTPIICPCCEAELTPEQAGHISGRYLVSRRRNPGRKGGRKPKVKPVEAARVYVDPEMSEPDLNPWD